MSEHQNGTERKPGIIRQTFDWVVSIIIMISLIGLAWRYVIHPLFFF